MALLLEIGLTNALLATALAGAAAAVCWRWPHPALGHVLWLLVLARLLAPPLWSVPVTMPSSPAPIVDQLPLLVDAVTTTGTIELAPPAVLSSPALQGPDASPSPAAWSWADVAGGLWLASSLAFLTYLILQAARFRRIVAGAALAGPDLQRRVAELAARLGIRRPPEVRWAEGRFPPVLWGLGRRATVLLPADLLARWTSAEIDTVLAHELAHARRGDRWVRVVELAALSLYWWHPIAWLAVRRLRAAEELCCDGWVAHLLPGQTKDYARCLLSAVEFLGPPSVAVPLPGVGMGAKSFAIVQRRIAMILNHDARFRLPNRARLAVLALALLLLPLTLVAADPQAAGKIDPAQRAAMIDTATQAFQANQTAYDVGRVDLGQLYSWSRRWLDAESLGAAVPERQQAAQRHLERMQALHRRVTPLYEGGRVGGESENFHATEYFVAEAKLILDRSAQP